MSAGEFWTCARCGNQYMSKDVRDFHAANDCAGEAPNEDLAELRRRAARVVQEWHDDDLSADAVSHMAELLAGTERERITRDDGDWLHCLCGNTPDMGGFDSCLTDGTPVEPLADGPWEGRLYVCMNCGRIVDQYTLEVVGRKAATS